MNMTEETKQILVSIEEIDRLCPVAKALSSPMRVRMIQLLSERSMNVNELAEALSMPVSTAALNVRQLEEAGLISTEIQPGVRGAMKLCTRRVDAVNMCLVPESAKAKAALTLRLPIGSYSAADSILPECGIASEHQRIGETNMPRAFYHPDRTGAQVLWLRGGTLEYRFSLGNFDLSSAGWLELSFELFPGLPGQPESAQTLLSFSLGAHALGEAVLQAEAGDPRGRLTPVWWHDTLAQHGQLVTLRIDGHGVTLCGKPLSSFTLQSLADSCADHLSFSISAPENSYGFTLFGEKFGSFPQGILIRAGK